jgi:hypothetical protein
MADLSLPLADKRAEPVERRATAIERFLTWPRAGAIALFVLFALSFNNGGVHDDGTVYFDFMRRFFGQNSDGTAYQFGSAIWNAPFFLVSQLVAVRGGFDHFHSGEVAVNVASALAVVGAMYIGWRILQELELPRGATVLLLAVFGTPLFYYGALGASYKHAADALYATALFWFVLRSLRGGQRLDGIAVGLCLSLLVATRYANASICLAVLGSLLAFRRRRAALQITAAFLVGCVVIFGLPALRHIPYTDPPGHTYGLGSTTPDMPAVWTSQRVAEGTVVIIAPVLRHTTFSATAPIKMLFTLHRGLFLFTPLTAAATVGFLLAFRRDRRNRQFLAVIGISALALLAIHSFWGSEWDGGGSFSSRFLTALFPFFLVGTAEIVRRWRRGAVALLTVCAAWSLWIGLVDFNGYYNQDGHDGLPQIVAAFHGFAGPKVSRYHQPPPYNSLQNFGRQIGDRITSRWQFYWHLVT